MKKIISVILVFVISLSLCSCGKKSKEQYLGENPEAVKQYLDYANQLEKAGNAEAAAQVYTMIEKAVTADTMYSAREKLRDKSEYRLVESFTRGVKQFNEWKEVFER